IEASEKLAESGLLHSPDPQIKLAALLKAGELPESGKLYSEVDKLSKDKTITSDKWLNAAIKIYFREANLQEVDPSTVEMLVPAADERKSVWKYTTTDPGNNWNTADFNDSSWQKGEGPFGGKDAANANTLWTTPDIWMRKEVVLKKE